MLAQPFAVVCGVSVLVLLCSATTAHAQIETRSRDTGSLPTQFTSTTPTDAQASASPSQATPATMSETPRRGPSLRLLLAAEAALHSTDMCTTVYALRQSNVREANPVLARLSSRPAALVAVSGAVNVMQLYAISKLHRRHPKLAATWAVALIGLESYAVVNNIRVVRASGR